jgi:hypothetical protein
MRNSLFLLPSMLVIALSASACGSTVTLDGHDGPGGGSASTASGALSDCDVGPGDCPSDVSPDAEVPQGEAQKELVGDWVVCGSTDSLIGESGGTGITFSADGTFRLLAGSMDELSCESGFSKQGTWNLEDHAGIGLPDEYQLNLFWSGDGQSPVFVTFANGRSYIRLENGAGGWDDLARIE